jgi:hypothetical protein
MSDQQPPPVPQLSRRAVLVLLGAAIEDRHARFLTSIRPRLDNLAPLIVSEHGRGFWTVLDPPRDGADSRVAFVPEGPGLNASWEWLRGLDDEVHGQVS